LNEVTHVFVAQDLTPGQMRPENDEELEPVVVPFREALAWCQDATIRDAKTLVALLLWDRLREQG
ncbi:MAG TPA: NUDIX hydrolase, partial [Gemmataceae bacterium]|nr:NUDIX hydrolase [Gemmataceae bacterium]